LTQKTDHDLVYIARNRTKQRRQFLTYEAMWNAAKRLARNKWGDRFGGRFGASSIVHIALHEYLKKNGIDIKEQRRKALDKLKMQVCTSDNQ
jgi:hypothetical protein